jgi:hypothetical protein
VLIVFTSCESVNDYSFDESGTIEHEELEVIGKALVKSLQFKNEQEFYRYFDKDLFKVKVSEYLNDGTETVWNDYELNYFFEGVWSVLIDEEVSIRKFNLQNVFTEGNDGIIVVSALTNNGVRFYEFLVTNYNNAHRIYDIYYTDLGFKLSDAAVTKFPYDWTDVIYMDESTIWDIDNDFENGEYEEVISSYLKLQKESRDQPWLLGKYLGSKYQLGMYEDLEKGIDNMIYNTDFLKLRLFRQIPLADSIEFYVNRLEDRYGSSYVMDHFKNESNYYKRNLDSAENGLLTNLLIENDHATAYVYLAYIAVETEKYKDAIKYLKILQSKFDRDSNELIAMFENNDAFHASKEYKSWLATNLIKEIPEDEDKEDLINIFD